VMPRPLQPSVFAIGDGEIGDLTMDGCHVCLMPSLPAIVGRLLEARPIVDSQQVSSKLLRVCFTVACDSS
jgi:hypothetical protein